jgi:hypothetical protein
LQYFHEGAATSWQIREIGDKRACSVLNWFNIHFRYRCRLDKSKNFYVVQNILLILTEYFWTEDVPVSQIFENDSKEIKIWFRMKLRGDWIRVLVVTIQSRTFCLLVCCLKT